MHGPSTLPAVTQIDFSSSFLQRTIPCADADASAEDGTADDDALSAAASPAAFAAADTAVAVVLPAAVAALAAAALHPKAYFLCTNYVYCYM